MGYESVDVYVKDSTPLKAPVAGVVVKVLSADGALVYGMQQTDATGRASFLLPGGLTYQTRAYRFGYSFTQPLLMSVLSSPLPSGQTNTFDMTATNVAPPVPNDARLCTAYGYFRDITGAPQANVQIHFIAKFNPVWLDGAAVVKERIIVQTDAKGYAQVNLIRNGQYDCTIQGEEDIVRYIDVPDAPNVNLPDLIFPIVERVTTTPAGPNFTFAVGTKITLAMHVLTSDKNDLGKATSDVFYRVSPADIVTYWFEDDNMIVQGLVPGVASITLERADKSIVHIPDPGVLGQPLVFTVTP